MPDIRSRGQEKLAQALLADTSRQTVQLSFTGVLLFTSQEPQEATKLPETSGPVRSYGLSVLECVRVCVCVFCADLPGGHMPRPDCPSGERAETLETHTYRSVIFRLRARRVQGFRVSLRGICKHLFESTSDLISPIVSPAPSSPKF